MISFQIFKRLLQIAQYGSLTKAADALFVSRPALVQQVKAAEAKLGFFIFDRSAKGVTLTPVGKVFLEEGEPIIKNYEQLYWKCRRMADQNTKAVVIGTVPEIYSPLLFSVCRKYKKIYPNVDIVLKQKSFSDYFPAFLTGDFDITTDYMLNFSQDFLIDADAEILRCKPYQMDICVPTSNPLSSLKVASIKNLRGNTLMLYTRGVSKADDLLRDYLETHEPSIKIIDYSNYSHELLVKTEMENALLVSVRQFSFDLPNFTHVTMDWDFPVERGIIYRKDSRPETKTFIGLIKQEIEVKTFNKVRIYFFS